MAGYISSGSRSKYEVWSNFYLELLLRSAGALRKRVQRRTISLQDEYEGRSAASPSLVM